MQVIDFQYEKHRVLIPLTVNGISTKILATALAPDANLAFFHSFFHLASVEFDYFM